MWRVCDRMRLCAPAQHGNPQLTRCVSTPTAASAVVGSDFVDLGLDSFVWGTTGAAEPLGKKWVEGDEPILGVSRDVGGHEGQKYSRLNIPLAETNAGEHNLRHNSRSVVSSDEESRVLENNNDSDGNEDCSGGFEGKSLLDTNESDHHRPFLPYDDERFAEMLLEMEVEGAIDEAWQDTHKAHMEDVVEIVEVLHSLKVRDVCAIDVSEKTSNFDYMIFGTCEGPRHIHLAAWAVQEADSLKRICKIKRKQTDHTWEVVPVGRIIVNLMQEAVRDEMTLERKWAVTKSMDPLTVANAPISEGRQVKAHGLWTLTLNLQDLEDFEVDYCKDVLMRQL